MQRVEKAIAAYLEIVIPRILAGDQIVTREQLISDLGPVGSDIFAMAVRERQERLASASEQMIPYRRLSGTAPLVRFVPPSIIRME